MCSWLTSSWTSFHQLRLCNPCLPFLQTHVKDVLLWLSDIPTLVVTAKRPQWKKGLIPIMVPFPFYPPCQACCPSLLTSLLLLPDISDMGLSGRTITFCAGAQCRVLVCARGSKDVVQNNNMFFSYSGCFTFLFAPLFQTMRFKLWQVIVLLWFLTWTYIINSTCTETNWAKTHPPEYMNATTNPVATNG